jgi:hypothetical protein
MKANIFISILIASLTGACSSAYHAGSVNDDLYYSPKSNPGNNSTAVSPVKSAQESSTYSNTATPVAKPAVAHKAPTEPVSDYEKSD